MENPIKGCVYEPVDEQGDEIAEYLEQELRFTSSSLNLLSDGQGSTSHQHPLATRYAYARQSAFLSLESDQEDTDGSSSQYSRSSHGLAEVAPHAPALPETGTPRSLVISTPSGPRPPLPNFKLHQMPLTPNSRREVSFWSKTSSAISCITSDYYDQCSFCHEYDVIDGLIQCQCGDSYCHKCAKDLLLKAALRELFIPPSCCRCDQQIPRSLFLPFIDSEIESLLRTKYNDSPQPPAVKAIPKRPSQKWKQSQNFHRLTHAFGYGKNS